eukprot:m.255549 g.255549  ORF g.255549 m.255549 type:complete len:106 (-) comp15500_c1_seq22:430-747(-)
MTSPLLLTQTGTQALPTWTHDSLRLVACSNQRCSTPMSCHLHSSSDAQDTSTNRPMISFYSGATTALSLTICNNTLCTSHNTVVIGSENGAGTYTSLAISLADST